MTPERARGDTKMDVLKELSLIGIVPVIKIDRVEDALPLAGALCEGGLPCAEITFRTAAAKDAIAAITREYPDMIVGAGTVLTTSQVDDAIAAGSKFIVSPGFNPEVVAYCQSKGVPVIPGINNPTGIEQALSMGLKTVKFFPAEQSGGINMIKAMSAPYGAVTFMPTGGIGPANVNDYLSFGKILCCGGSWMVKADLINAGDFDGIKRLVRQAVDTMLGFKFKHMAINEVSKEAAGADADAIESVFGLAKKVGNSSTFASTDIEIMHNPGKGTHGHVGIQTNSVERAVYHLERRGVKFDHSTARFDANGKMNFIYLADEIGGFAFHLVH